MFVDCLRTSIPYRGFVQYLEKWAEVIPFVSVLAGYALV